MFTPIGIYFMPNMRKESILFFPTEGLLQYGLLHSTSFLIDFSFFSFTKLPCIF